MNPVVSVIMPVYNAEKYVGAAIESILKQSFDDFELLLVDDGSSDESGKICDMYALLDSRVRVFHQANAGRCYARNKGIEVARGQYIAFSDDDDEYDYNLLEDNVSLALKYDADIVRFTRRRFIIKNNKVKTVDVPKQTGQVNILSGRDIYKNMFYCRQVSFGVWSCLFKKNLLSSYNIKFDVNYRHGFEDHKFILESYYFVRTVVYNSRAYYNWYWRNGQSDSANINIGRLSVLGDLIATDKKLYIDKIKNCSDSDYWAYQCVVYILAVINHLVYAQPPLSYAQMKQFLFTLKNLLWENTDFKLSYPLLGLKAKTILFLFYNNNYKILLAICRIALFLKRRG